MRPRGFQCGNYRKKPTKTSKSQFYSVWASVKTSVTVIVCLNEFLKLYIQNTYVSVSPPFTFVSLPE